MCPVHIVVAGAEETVALVVHATRMSFSYSPGRAPLVEEFISFAVENVAGF